MPYEGPVAFMAVNSAAFNVVMNISEFRILTKYGRNVLSYALQVFILTTVSFDSGRMRSLHEPILLLLPEFWRLCFYLPGLVRCCQNRAESDYRLISLSSEKRCPEGNQGCRL